MSNITKIKISGTSYDIKDENACNVVELTQAEYDALPTSAKTSNSLFVITDATAGDLSNYYTKSETSGATEISTALASKADTATTYTKTEVDNAITAATSTKQDTLVSGTNIKTINNESILGSGNIEIQGGGGKAVSGGTNISITTGETADTINCTLPIKKIQGRESVIIGDSRNTVDGNANVAVGYQNSINAKGSSYIPDHCFVGGQHNNVYNTDETAFGIYNNSVQNTSVGGRSGTTLFSIGNGTADNARHNAFEIRQNGDIYLTKDGQDVKLQDQLGGGSITIDPSLDASSTNPVANSAITRNLTNGNGDVEKTGGKYKWAFYSVGGYGTSQGFYLDTINGDTVVKKHNATRNLSLVETSAITASITSASTDSQIPSAKAVYDALQEGGGGGGGMTEDDELLLATALTDLNDRKIDASEVKSNYQKKGDYVTTNTLNTRLAEYETALDEQNVEEVTAYALNDLNNKFGGLSLVKITESEYAALTTKDENTLYIVVADPQTR